MENSPAFTAAKENHMLTPKNSQDFEGSLLVSMILPLLSTFWTQNLDNASDISGSLQSTKWFLVLYLLEPAHLFLENCGHSVIFPL